MDENRFALDDHFECCPVCGYECAHISDVVRDDSHFMSRQGNVTIYFEGECDHRWVRVFSEHKGNISKGVFIIQDRFILHEGVAEYVHKQI